MSQPGPTYPASVAALLERASGSASATAQAEAATKAVDAVLWNRDVRAQAASLAARSRAAGARANATFEGADLDPRALGATGADRESPMGQVVASAVDLAAGARRYADLVTVSPLQALAEAATVVGRRFLPPSELGRPRTGDSCDDPLHLPGLPPAAAVPSRLLELGQVLSGGSGRALLVAAVVHAELALVRPFAWGSGLLARSSIRWVLAARGVDPDMLTVPELGLLEIGRTKYVRALRAYQLGSPEGVSQWVATFSEAIAIGARVTSSQPA